MRARLITLFLVLFVCLTTSVPYIVGWTHQGPANTFLAATPGSPADTPSYFSQIEQARQGRWIFANQFTSEPQTPSLFQPMWLLTGWLGRWLHLSTPVMFQIARVIAATVFVWLATRLFSGWGLTRPHQLIAGLILVGSGGVGWVWLHHVYEGRSILQAPVDLWVDEATTFFSLSHSALFIVSQTLSASLLWLIFRQTSLNQRVGWWPGILVLLLGIIHPYDIVPIVGITLVWGAAWATQDSSRGRRRQTLLTIGSWLLWVVPVITYYYAVPWQQPAVRGWFIQNINLSPTPLAVLLGYGLLWPLALGGAITSWNDPRRPTRLLACWVVVILALLYLPGFSIQRRFISGLHIPLAILAGFGVIRMIQHRPRGIQIWASVVIVGFVCLTPVMRVISDSRHIAKPQLADYPVYLNHDTMGGISWLKTHSSLDDVVVANFWLSNSIAGLAARPEVFAHTNQTVASWDREQDVKKITDPQTPPTTRRAILERLRASWLFWTKEDEARTNYHPSEDAVWSSAYTEGTVAIYHYKSTAPAPTLP